MTIHSHGATELLSALASVATQVVGEGGQSLSHSVTPSPGEGGLGGDAATPPRHPSAEALDDFTVPQRGEAMRLRIKGNQRIYAFGKIHAEFSGFFNRGA